MNHSRHELNQDILFLKLFQTKVDLADLPEKLTNLNKSTDAAELQSMQDRLEGLMHAEGAGAIICKNKSLPQIVQKILIHLRHLDQLC